MFRTLSAAWVALAAVALMAGPAAAANISGAGSTFAAPIYAKWAELYRAQTRNVLNYQPIGSGGGIKQIRARTVDFGASDKPMKPADLQAAGLIQFPTVVGGVVPVVNLPGLRPGQLRLTGPVLAQIFLGDIKTWNDPRIAALNPGVKLMRLPITVVHRSDGSGTTFVFTTYLAGQTPEWGRRVGANDAVQWPAGIGGKGNDGVGVFVKQTIGSIGYVEYAFAKQTHLIHAQLRNRAGAFVEPTSQTFGAAAASADWAKAPGNYLLLIDQPGAQAWPISGATFALMYKAPSKPDDSREVLRFFDWAFRNGDASALNIDYVPLPGPVKDMVRKQWADSIKAPDGKPLYIAH